jgi:hypothetical protein
LGISSAWAQDENSFEAVAELNSYKLVPPILSSRTGTLELTFVKPASTTDGSPITGEALALASPLNPWIVTLRAPGDESFAISNIRLYFGQYFANGQPIATLCDNAIDTLRCSEFMTAAGTVKISDIQFHDAQFPNEVGSQFSLIDCNSRLREDESGFNILMDFIRRGLIYVVVNSPYTAVQGQDILDCLNPENSPMINRIVEYDSPLCNFKIGAFCFAPDRGRTISDGDVRGTLRLTSQNNVLRRLSEFTDLLGL